MTQLNPKITTHNLGFPRIGKNRELKKALEAYWGGKISQEELYLVGKNLRREHWQLQAKSGLDIIPTGDFAWYDQVLTLSATVGNIPSRHRKENIIAASQHSDDQHDCHSTCSHNHDSENTKKNAASQACDDIDLDTLFRVARGTSPSGSAESASDMTKWFDTNYHYIVPEFHPNQSFALSWTQIIDETAEAIAQGFSVKPVILGPLSYLYLGKELSNDKSFSRLSLLDNLLPVYKVLIEKLVALGVEWIQIDEPILALDLPNEWQKSFEPTYNKLQNPKAKILLATYFGGLEDNLSTTLQLPVAGIHIDAIRSPEQILPVVDRLSAHKILSIGIVDGRNIWRNNFSDSIQKLQPAYERLGNRLWLAPSCSLLHSPVDLALEERLAQEIKAWFSFATQKISEVQCIKKLLENPADEITSAALRENQNAVHSRATSTFIHQPSVQNRIAQLKPQDAQRQSPFAIRIEQQQKSLKLPLFPTTTIGSFPQTPDIRALRLDFKKERISPQVYKNLLRDEIAKCIEEQEVLGLDVLVHGEAERNDMVEYFGESLEGFVFTDFGWVQSYGSRCVKPPIIVGDVWRKAPITVEWARFAQSLSDKPVKGMLTGPITILCWSFVRDDQPRSITAKQIALALRDEVCDLETAGIQIIQIDEPAIREGLPLRKKHQANYLHWAVEAFRLSASGVKDKTQIHTHMCYSEFNEIIGAIADLDADVITIETSRSQGDLLQAFEKFNYPNDIGPGVYDIHSPNLPQTNDMVTLMKRAAQKVSPERLWINPDCGLKTRSWDETRKALHNMVTAARQLREEFSAAE